MQCYFFNIRDSRGVIADDEGLFLPDLAAARMEADMSMREIVAHRVSANQETMSLSIEITDARGVMLERVRAN